MLRSALPAIADEMSTDLQRTSYNMMIYEVRDYCCAILDTQGRLISQNIGGVSHFVADLGVVIKDAVAQHGIDGFKPGDVVITNHQRVAGQHLNNICIYTPFFFEDTLTAFSIVRAHWVDVGGNSTGFGAGTSIVDPWQEGLQFDQIKIYEAGVTRQEDVEDDLRQTSAIRSHRWATCARRWRRASSANTAWRRSIRATVPRRSTPQSNAFSMMPNVNAG